MRRNFGIQSIIAAALVTGCAGTTTKLAPITPAEVDAEELKQRELVLVTHEDQQARLDRLAHPILAGATALCGAEVRGATGFRYASIHSFDKDWRTAAANVFGLNDSIQVVAVLPGGPADRAGLRKGDRILAVNGVTTVPGKASASDLTKVFEQVTTGGMRRLTMAYERDGTAHTTELALDTVCRFPALVLDEGDLNAYADGDAIYVTSTMMRFAEDDELRVVLGHELAHNAMGHIKAQKQNALLGALVGALGDVALATAGVNTGGYYTGQGAQLGAMTFSQNFEREADYVGLYAMALAGFGLTEAPTFWRHMAQANPKSIGMAYSHPTTAERFVRMDKAIREIEAKRAAGQPLRPTLKE
jgi:hypothetical protein